MDRIFKGYNGTIVLGDTSLTIKRGAKASFSEDQLTSSEDEDRKEFLEFAFSFIQDTGRYFLEPYVTKEYRMACKQTLFPDRIHINTDRKVYTPEISVFFRGVVKKKTPKRL